MLNLLFGPPRAAGNDGWSTGWYAPRMKTSAGVIVDEEIALTWSAIWCATRVICETCAGLPLFTYERVGQDDREFATDYPLFDILHSEPNPDMPSMAFREGRTMHQVNWGNGFAEIEWDSFVPELRTRVVALWPIHPSRVKPVCKRTHQDLYRQGYRYLVRNDDNTEVAMKADEMLHFPGVFPEDGIWGKGVIRYARESIGFGLATERHGSAYFGGGAQPKGVMTMPGMKDAEARRQYRKEWKEVHGSPESAEIAIIPVDAKYTPITIPNDDSQFLQTRVHNVSVVAQWYRLPPHKIMDLTRSTNNNIEIQGIDFVGDGILPWLRRQEAQYHLKLLPRRDRRRYFIEHQVAGLLRGDLASRMTSYVQALQNGIMTLNEVRRLENLNSIGPPGDVHFVQLNMTTVERLAAGDTGPGRANGLDGPDAAKLFDDWTRFASARLAGQKSATALLPAPPQDSTAAAANTELVSKLVSTPSAPPQDSEASADQPWAPPADQAAADPGDATGPPPADSAAGSGEAARETPPNAATLQVPREAIRTAIVDALARGFTKISLALKREKAPLTDLTGWLTGFEARHCGTLEESLAAAGAMLGCSNPGPQMRFPLVSKAHKDLAAAFDSLTRAQFATFLDEWPRTAAAALADKLMEECLCPST